MTMEGHSPSGPACCEHVLLSIWFSGPDVPRELGKARLAMATRNSHVALRIPIHVSFSESRSLDTFSNFIGGSFFIIDVRQEDKSPQTRYITIEVHEDDSLLLRSANKVFFTIEVRRDISLLERSAERILYYSGPQKQKTFTIEVSQSDTIQLKNANWILYY